MSRKTLSFRQLIEYFNKESTPETPEFIHNIWALPKETEAIVRAFEENAALLPKRQNGNYLYHEVITLKKGMEVPLQRQAEILHDLVQQFIQLRAPNQMAFGKLHQETDHLHYHMLITANSVHGKKRLWMKKSEFAAIQRDIERYKIERYPELGQDHYYDPKGRTIRREKERREEAIKIAAREYELKRRSGKPTQKEQDREIIKAIFETTLSEPELDERLKNVGFERYQRGTSEGVRSLETGRKYRLKTLGLSRLLQKAKSRNRVYDERAAELELLRAQRLERNKDDGKER